MGLFDSARRKFASKTLETPVSPERTLYDATLDQVGFIITSAYWRNQGSQELISRECSFARMKPPQVNRCKDGNIKAPVVCFFELKHKHPLSSFVAVKLRCDFKGQ